MFQQKLVRGAAALGDNVQSDAPKPASVADARAIAQTDPYLPNFGTANRIALLDTGMRFTHTLNSNNGSGLRFDCVNGTSNSCQTGTNLNYSIRAQ